MFELRFGLRCYVDLWCIMDLCVNGRLPGELHLGLHLYLLRYFFYENTVSLVLKISVVFVLFRDGSGALPMSATMLQHIEARDYSDICFHSCEQ